MFLGRFEHSVDNKGRVAVPARFLGRVHPHFREVAQFLAVVPPDLRCSLRQFHLESRPSSLVLTVVFALEQSESYLGGQLGDTGEVLDAEAIQNLCSCEFARPLAERTLDVLACCWRSHGHRPRGAV